MRHCVSMIVDTHSLCTECRALHCHPCMYRPPLEGQLTGRRACSWTWCCHQLFSHTLIQVVNFPRFKMNLPNTVFEPPFADKTLHGAVKATLLLLFLTDSCKFWPIKTFRLGPTSKNIHQWFLVVGDWSFSRSALQSCGRVCPGTLARHQWPIHSVGELETPTLPVT